MASLDLSSPAFADEAPIPDQYGYTEQDVNPPLELDGIPAESESLALVMDDPDAIEPAGKIWDHWLVWNIDPETTSIPEGWDAAGAIEGQNDFDGLGYGGPNPPDREHTYRFTVYPSTRRSSWTRQRRKPISKTRSRATCLPRPCWRARTPPEHQFPIAYSSMTDYD